MDRRLALALTVAVTSLAGRASAHGGSLGPGAREPLAIPAWLFLTTGGATVGASFLLASFVTDRSFVATLHDWRLSLPFPGRRPLAGAVSALGVVSLGVVVVTGFLGPSTPTENAGYLLAWVGWWAGFAMSTYLVGNSWPVLNPWRTIAGVLPSFDRPYPDRVGAWPAVVGLLALVYLEVVGPPTLLGGVSTPPVFLATLAVGYTLVTLGGATLYGDVWFDRADPVSRVFRCYGCVAPVTVRRAGDGTAIGLDVRLPGTALSEPRFVDGRDEVAFVVALLWVTTFDGLVATPTWRAVLQPLGVNGWSARAVYLVAMAVGFLLFWWLFLWAVDASRDLSEAHVSTTALARQFAPPLLAIAAGYHLAHYLGYFLRLSPALVESLLSPLSATGSVLTLPLPAWFGGVGLASVLVGHLLAIWVAHANAYERFTSRLQAIRSQYPFIAVMILYTMTSLWILSQPVVEPPFL